MTGEKRVADLSGGMVSLVLLALAFTSPNAAALDNQKELSRYGRQSWQTESGLPQNKIHAIFQTRDGYIWLRTEGGVVRLDVHMFGVYDSLYAQKVQRHYVT